MSIKSLLQDVGLVEGQAAETEEHVQGHPAPSPPVRSPAPVVVPPSPPVQVGVGVLDQETYDRLSIEVDGSAKPKFLTFRDMLEKMSQIQGMTVMARYQAASAASGITKAEAIASVEAMLQRLDKEEDEWKTAADTQIKKTVEGLQSEIAGLQRLIADDRQRITDLEASIAAREGEVVNKTNEVAGALGDFQAAILTFQATAESLRKKLESTKFEAGNQLLQ